MFTRSFRYAFWLSMISLCSLPGRAAGIDSVVAFGDSTSDVGNVYSALGIPASPYVNGQFSNGNVFSQALASLLGVAPLKPSLLGGTDYAYGSAQTGTTPFNTASIVDLTGPVGQVAQFTANHPTGGDPNALYTIWVGSNDLGAIPTNATNAQISSDLGTIVGNIDSAVTSLAALKAKNFLIVTVPDLGKTPVALAAGAGAAAGETALSASFNNVLVNGSGPISSLAVLAALDGVNITVLDSYSQLDSIVANPGALGFTNVTSPCYTGSYAGVGGSTCSNPNQYLFWDSIHPTAAAYQIAAQGAVAVLTPEPGSMALLSGGLLGLFIIRKRLQTGN